MVYEFVPMYDSGNNSHIYNDGVYGRLNDGASPIILDDPEVAVEVDELDGAGGREALVPRQELPHGADRDADAPDGLGDLEAEGTGQGPQTAQARHRSRRRVVDLCHLATRGVYAHQASLVTAA
eukprot:6180606-Pleurochrysis_carterae.AAC.3